MKNKVFLVSLEGSQCSFKSYLLNHLRKKYANYIGKILLIEEPLNDMSFIHTKDKVINSFDTFNKNPHTFAETLQHHIITCITKNNYNLFTSNEYMNARIVFMERNLNSSLAFIKQYHTNKLLSEIQVNILLERIKEINRMCKFPTVDKQIYLYIPPEIGVKLVKIRGRAGEIEYITEDYLKQLHKIQMSMFSKVYTCTNDITYIYNIINKHLNLTKQEVDNLPNIHDIRTNHVNLTEINY